MTTKQRRGASGHPARRAEETATSRPLLAHDCDIPEQIVSLANHREDLELAIASAVAHAREHGLSWAHIGGLLGVSKQAAMKRYRTASDDA